MKLRKGLLPGLLLLAAVVAMPAAVARRVAGLWASRSAQGVPGA